VNDIVEANVCAMNSRVEYGVFNAGTGISVSINDMISLLGEKLGQDLQPEYVENTIKNYVQHTGADTSKAERLLGFKARIPLENGIERQVECYKEAPEV
jgi:UDP-glucose 4-epimerase